MIGTPGVCRKKKEKKGKGVVCGWQISFFNVSFCFYLMLDGLPFELTYTATPGGSVKNPCAITIYFVQENVISHG